MKGFGDESVLGQRERALRRLMWFAAVVFVLGVAVFLRTSFLATNPGWYPDEGSDLDIAWNLWHGQWRYFALGGTPLVAGRVPLFHFLMIGSFQVFGYDIFAARIMVAAFSIATIVLVLIVVREMVGKWTALLSALLLAIMPNSFLYSRIAFAYNVQGFFAVLCWCGLWKFYNTRKTVWLVGAAVATAAAYMIALTGLPLIACVVLVALLKKPASVLWALPLMLAPGAMYLAMLYLSSPNALTQDLALMFGRTSDSVFAQFFNLVSNYVLWFDWTFWVVLGVVGLFLLPSRSLRWLTLLIFFAILFNVMRAFPGAGDLNLHRYLSVLPFLAIGAARFLVCAMIYVRNQIASDMQALRLSGRLNVFQNARVRALLVFGLWSLLVIFPILWLTMWDAYIVAAPLSPRATPLDFVSVTEPADARQVAAWVNANTRAEDVVLASPTIAWLLDARAADFQQALAYEGIVTDNYGAGLPRPRFLYDVSLQNAKFVIVDRAWRGWGARRMPPLQDYLRRMEVWSRVASYGEFDVYRNPAR